MDATRSDYKKINTPVREQNLLYCVGCLFYLPHGFCTNYYHLARGVYARHYVLGYVIHYAAEVLGQVVPIFLSRPLFMRKC